MKNDLQETLRNLLKQLFHFDNEDLDFGLYRIINYNKKQIQQFIEVDLIAEIGSLLVNKVMPANPTLQAIEEIELEIYNHILRFFSRYYQQGDFIPLRRFGKTARYVIPHNGEEITFHWANKNQYYVKSGEIFTKYQFSLEDWFIQFRLLASQEEKGNIKAPQKKYFLLHSRPAQVENRQIFIFFEYRALTEKERNSFGKTPGQADVNNDIIKLLRCFFASRKKFPSLLKKIPFFEHLENHLSKFTRKQTKDYFIHKNLREFLETELDFFIKNEVLNFENFMQANEQNLALNFLKAQIIQRIAQQIIAFLAQIEDFQKKIWEKKSFVLKTDYVITLRQLREIAGEIFYQKILPEICSNKPQIEEWRRLFKFSPRRDNASEIATLLDLPKWQNLPLDSVYFPGDFKLNLLNALSREKNLDDLLDGILFKSENWHALNLLQSKFRSQVKTVYIDPPFNKEQEADYFYKVGYKDSTWNTFLDNRIRAAANLIAENGCIFVRCDYNGNTFVRLLLNEIFGKENFRNELVINRTLAKQRVDSQFVVQTESLFLYSKSERFITKPVERPTPSQWYPLLHFPRKDERPRMVLGETFYPPKNRRWALSQERIDQLQTRGKLRINREAFYIDFRGKKTTGMPEVLYDSEAVGNDWLDIPGYAQRHHFPTENAEALLQRVFESTSQPGELVMDFFLGSGTAVAVAHKLQRKWIGIEMGEHFHTVILPRMKAVLFGDKSGISKSVNWRGGGFFKYQQLEQFEDTLENIQFHSASPALAKLDDYFIRYKIHFETQNSAPFLNLPLIRDPFHYRMTIVHNYEYQAQEVDLVETFNYLLGIHLKRFEIKEDQNRRYVFIEGNVKEESALVIWRSVENLDFQKDKEFIEKHIAGYAYDKIYANGDCAVAGFKNIEIEMRERLLLNTGKD